MTLSRFGDVYPVRCCVTGRKTEIALTFSVVQYAWMHGKQFNLPKEENRFLKYGARLPLCLLLYPENFFGSSLWWCGGQNSSQRNVQVLECSSWLLLAWESRLLLHGGRLRRPKVK